MVSIPPFLLAFVVGLFRIIFLAIQNLCLMTPLVLNGVYQNKIQSNKFEK